MRGPAPFSQLTALLACMLVLGCCATQPLRVANLDELWAKDVLLGTEAGDARDAVVRWCQPVHYLLVAAPERVQQAVTRAFDLLQGALAKTQTLSLDTVPDDDARIGQDGYVTIFAVPPRRAATLAATHGAQTPQPDADGWFTIIWNRRFELTRAVVFLDPDLSDVWLRHTALEELFQVLGPSNDSPRIANSLVFESATLAGSKDVLAPVDLQVLHLLYRDLRPGDRAAEIEQAMRRSWVFGGSSAGTPSPELGTL